MGDPDAVPAIGLRVLTSNPRCARPTKIRSISGFLCNGGRFSDDYLDEGLAGSGGAGDRRGSNDSSERPGEGDGIMRQLTGKNGPRGTIRIIETLALSDRSDAVVVHRGRPTSSVDGPRPAQQSDETKPMLIWERFIEGMDSKDRCGLSQNLRNKANVNLDKVCELDWLVKDFGATGRTMQTKPILPEWQSGGLRGHWNHGANEAIAVMMAASARKRQNKANINLDRFRGMRGGFRKSPEPMRNRRGGSGFSDRGHQVIPAFRPERSAATIPGRPTDCEFLAGHCYLKRRPDPAACSLGLTIVLVPATVNSC
jgi:hypothetical protein